VMIRRDSEGSPPAVPMKPVRNVQAFSGIQQVAILASSVSSLLKADPPATAERGQRVSGRAEVVQAICCSNPFLREALPLMGFLAILAANPCHPHPHPRHLRIPSDPAPGGPIASSFPCSSCFPLVPRLNKQLATLENRSLCGGTAAGDARRNRKRRSVARLPRRCPALLRRESSPEVNSAGEKFLCLRRSSMFSLRAASHFSKRSLLRVGPGNPYWRTLVQSYWDHRADRGDDVLS